MPRGFFTQCTTVLLDRLPPEDAVVAALDGYEIRATRPGEDDPGWFGGFPELVVAYRPELNGYVTIERIDRPWPDSMGDPDSDFDTFGAWSMGSFGPGAYPGNLRRAVQQAVAWREGAAQAAEQHRALLRIRSSYVFGAGENAPILPEGADLLDELTFVTQLSAKLCALPEALAFFNPGGEVLLDASLLAGRLAHAAEHTMPPLDAFAHVRMVNIEDAPGWALMDTVGMEQLFLPDHEACFDESREPDEVAIFLLNLALYLVQNGEVIEQGHTVDGPGGTWRCRVASDEPLMAPPRRTLRWFPDDVRIPDVLR